MSPPDSTPSEENSITQHLGFALPGSESKPMTPRGATRRVMVGDVPVGGGAPVTIQSMTTTRTADVDGTLAQIYALAAAGCDIVRCTCNDVEAAEGLAHIVPRSPIPVIADISRMIPVAYTVVMVLAVVGILAMYLDLTQGISA